MVEILRVERATFELEIFFLSGFNNLRGLSKEFNIKMEHASVRGFSQRKYTLDLLKEIGKLGRKPTSTPLELNWKNKEDETEDPMDKERYQWLVGKLTCLSLTRPHTAYTMSVMS